MSLLRLTLNVVLALTAAHDSASQNNAAASSCTGNAVPASVATQDERFVRGIAPEKFKIKIAGKEAVGKASADNGPRRILFLVDIGKDVNQDGWKMMVQLATRVATQARPQDRFALLTYGGPQVEVAFSERDAILATLAEFQANRPKPALEGGYTYDGLMEATARFGTGVYGDSIFLLVGGEDTKSKASQASTVKALQKMQIRLFGFVMSRSDTSDAQIAVLVERLETSSGIRALDSLARESGGLLMVENTKPFNRPFVASPVRIDRVFQVCWRMYGQMVETYRFELSPSPSQREESWVVVAPKEIEEKVPGVQVRTPEKIFRCTNNSPT